jgi:integrase/recombinase XerD
LQRPEKLLQQFIGFLESEGVERITTKHALTWACKPAYSDSNWRSQRLSVVRSFASYLQNLDVDVEVPPRDLLPPRPRRASPYLYSEQEIMALFQATSMLRFPLRVATYQTLIGLLAVTGMRVGEAIDLDREDFDVQHGVILVRHAKFNKTRELPLHTTAVTALCHYLTRRDRTHVKVKTPALFISPAGTRLLYCNVHWTFRRLVHHAGLAPRTRSCRPRIHDIRHSFAVSTLIDAYREGVDPQQRLAVLSTYLGHVDPARTYWYLSGSPELLGRAAERLERCGGARP